MKDTQILGWALLISEIIVVYFCGIYWIATHKISYKNSSKFIVIMYAVPFILFTLYLILFL